MPEKAQAQAKANAQSTEAKAWLLILATVLFFLCGSIESRSQEPTLYVCMFSMDGCVPCRWQWPILQRVIVKPAKLIYVNSERHNREWGVDRFPTTIWASSLDGKTTVLHRQVGLMPEPDIATTHSQVLRDLQRPPHNAFVAGQ